MAQDTGSPNTCGCSARWDSSRPGPRDAVGCTASNPRNSRPLHDWLAKYEQAWNARLDRVDDYLHELQQKGEQQ